MATYKYRSVTQIPIGYGPSEDGLTSCKVDPVVSVKSHDSSYGGTTWARVQEHRPVGTTITIERIETHQSHGQMVPKAGATWQPWARFVVDRGGVRQVKEAK